MFSILRHEQKQVLMARKWLTSKKGEQGVKAAPESGGSSIQAPPSPRAN